MSLDHAPRIRLLHGGLALALVGAILGVGGVAAISECIAATCAMTHDEMGSGSCHDPNSAQLNGVLVNNEAAGVFIYTGCGRFVWDESDVNVTGLVVQVQVAWIFGGYQSVVVNWYEEDGTWAGEPHHVCKVDGSVSTAVLYIPLDEDCPAGMAPPVLPTLP